MPPGRSDPRPELSNTESVLKPPAGGGLAWSGQIPHLKWTQFYTRVLTKLVDRPGLELHLDLRVPPEGEVTEATHDEVSTALRELGLDDEVTGG